MISVEIDDNDERVISAPIGRGKLLKVIHPDSSKKEEIFIKRWNKIQSRITKPHLTLFNSDESMKKFKQSVNLNDESKCNYKTFKTLINEYLEIEHPNIKILDIKKINEFNKIFEDYGIQISFDRLKNTLQQISAVNISNLREMTSFETRLRYGLKKNESLIVKSYIENIFYIPYSQFLSQYEQLPSFVKFLNKYHSISVMNFENLSNDEVKFLGRYTSNKSLVIYSDIESKNKPKQFENNWKQIDSYFKNIREVELTILEKEENIKEEYNKSLFVQLEENENQINKKSLKDFILTTFKIFNNPKTSNLELLKIISITPGFDKYFIKTFSELVERENLPVIEFINKYYDSFSDKTKEKLLPIINYIKNIQIKLNKNDANSIMIHFLNFCNIIEFDTKSNKEIKNQLVDLHIWLKKLNKSNEFQIFNNLLECYMENEMKFKEIPSVNNTIPILQDKKPTSQQPKLINAMVNFKLPVSISIDNTSNKENSKLNLNGEEETPLRRSGSTKYKPRPRSWHAGNIFNAARKLK